MSMWFVLCEGVITEWIAWLKRKNKRGKELLVKTDSYKCSVLFRGFVIFFVVTNRLLLCAAHTSLFGFLMYASHAHKSCLIVCKLKAERLTTKHLAIVVPGNDRLGVAFDHAPDHRILFLASALDYWCVHKGNWFFDVGRKEELLMLYSLTKRWKMH